MPSDSGGNTLRQREGDQPLPTPGHEPVGAMVIRDIRSWYVTFDTDVTAGVITDLEARIELGLHRYGRPLETFNGRDALLDAYQELLDAAHYLRQAYAEALVVGKLHTPKLRLMYRNVLDEVVELKATMTALPHE